jgi:outer membrane protein
MKKFLALSVLALSLFVVPVSVRAQTPTLKIAFIDLQRVMMESEKGKEARKNLADEFEKLKKNLVQKQDDLQKTKDALERQSTTMTPEARADKEKQYQIKLKDYQRLQSDYESDLRQKDQEFSQKILKDLEEVVKGLGESDKYSLILERSQAGILYGTPAIDATDKVITLYNDTAKKKAAPKK